MIPDRLGYFLNDFWNFEILVKIWTRGAPNYYQHASQIQENMESPWENIIFVNMGLTKFRNISKSVCPRYQVFSIRFSISPGFSCDLLSTYFENILTKMRIER